MKTKSTAMAQYVLCFGALLTNLSAGMFNIALIDIAGEFHQSVTSTQWVVAAYLLTVSVCLPLMGSLGDLRGRHNVHNVGLLVFMAGGLCCALAPNLASLLGFRIVQGVGASMYQATNMALTVSLFPPQQRGRALGMVNSFAAAGALVGPSLGGVMIEWFSWRVNFWLLAAVSLCAWMLARRVIPRDRTAGQVKPDVRGAALFALSLTGLVTGLNLGGTRGWTSTVVWLLLALFIVLGGVFVRWSLSPRWKSRKSAPFIRLGLLNHPFIIFGILLTIVTYGAAFATQLVLPVILRNVMDMGPAAAGFMAMAYPASLILSAPVSGRSSDRFGSVPLIILGLSCLIIALAALSFLTAGTGNLYVVTFIVLLGCAMGMIVSPNNNIIMRETPQSNLGMMSSMIALNRNLGMMFGAAAGGLLLSASPAGSSLDGAEVLALLRSVREWYIGMAAVVCAALLIFVWIVRRSGRADPGAAGKADAVLPQ